MGDGGLDTYLHKHKAPGPVTRVRLALDIALGMNVLHMNKPVIVHR